MARRWSWPRRGAGADRPREGLAVAADKGVTVAIDAVLTPELRAEGLARELVRRLQEMRKKAGFNIEDRIHTFYQAPPDSAVKKVLDAWAETIQSETLSLALVEGDPPDGAFVEEQDVEGNASAWA